MDIVERLRKRAKNYHRISKEDEDEILLAVEEIESLRRRLASRKKQVEILRTLLDKGASVDEFMAAVRAVIDTPKV